MAGRLEPLDLDTCELTLMNELLDAERAKLLVEIRYTHHRTSREGLRDRLKRIERLVDRCARSAAAE